jgi:hypothetical protein
LTCALRVYTVSAQNYSRNEKSIISWRAINGTDLSGLNAALAGAGKIALAKAVGVEAPACGPIM